MNLAEKTEKELKELNPKGSKPDLEIWSCGFRIGFEKGYALAYEEANERLRKIERGEKL